MASVVLRDCLNKLRFLKTTAIVSCEMGRVTIDITQDDRFLLDGIVDYRGVRKSHKIYNKADIYILMGYLGIITEITTLNHDTDEEKRIF